LTIGAITLAIASSGCLEHQIKSRGATGVVLDKGTQLPVSHARIVISEYYEDNPALSNVLKRVRKPTVTTDTNGSFAIPPKYKWVVTVPIGDYWPPTGSLVIQCAGYSTGIFPVSGVTPTNMLSTKGRVQYLLERQIGPSSR
jgi:hypothetical protein